MTMQPDPLARLRADRAAALAQPTVLQALASPLAVDQRCAIARKFGRDVAAHRLTWVQITWLRDLLKRHQKSEHEPWGRPAIECVTGPEVAAAIPFGCYQSWLAFLAGIEEIAQAVESQG